jgi:hypothetical protein
MVESFSKMDGDLCEYVVRLRGGVHAGGGGRRFDKSEKSKHDTQSEIHRNKYCVTTTPYEVKKGLVQKTECYIYIGNKFARIGERLA